MLHGAKVPLGELPLQVSPCQPPCFAGRAPARCGVSAGAFEERISLDPSSPWFGEHRSRYHFARQFVAGATVLDIACGTGFGAPIMFEGGAARVLSADLDPVALTEAAAQLSPHQLLCRADVTRLPLAMHSVDVITSFETLEHVTDAPAMLRELRRVLRPAGSLVLSTPNALHTKPVDGVPANPFHVKEYLPQELSELLRDHFGSVQLLGQRTSPRFKVSPYWDRPELLPTDPIGRARVLSWKVQARLPFQLRERLSRSLHGHGFYPGEDDFVFDAGQVEQGHVLVAVCRP